MSRSLIVRFARCIDRGYRFNRLVSRSRWANLKGTVTCLLYHRIAEHGEQRYLQNAGVPYTPPVVFHRQLVELRARGAEFFTLSDLSAGRFPSEHSPGFVITFDDGFADNFRVGLDILSDLDIRAVFFIATDMVARTSLTWEHLLYFVLASSNGRERLVAERRRLFGEQVDADDLAWIWRSLATRQQCDAMLSACHDLTKTVPAGDLGLLYPAWEDLSRASSSGHEIGSHTVSHRARHLFTAAEYLEQLRASKNLLESRIQASVTSFSYPYNCYFFEDDEIARNAGFTQIATVDDGRLTSPMNLNWIPRLTLHSGHDSQIQFRRLVLEGRN